jgi:hypothetical protein
MTDREAIKMALALAKFEHLWDIGIDAAYKVELLPEIRVLRQALAQPEIPMSPEHLPQYIATNNIKPTTEGGGGAGGAQPEQEPVAWIGNADFVKGQFVEGRVRRIWWECNTGVGQPLYTAPPKREWVGLTDDDWEQLWQDIEDACDEWEVAYQEEAQKKHGEGHYYISSEDQWEYDKRTIRDLVEAKLKEKNGGV